MNADTPHAAPVVTPKRGLPQPPLSLTKAAKTVSVSTSTLRRAIEDGKLKAVKSEEGHWRIKVDQLMQYKSNELDSPATLPATLPAAGSVAAPVAQAATDPADRRAGTVSRDMHDTVVDMYEARLRDKDKEVSRLENTASDYRSDFKDMQQKYDTSQLVLTDQREESEKLKAKLEAAEKEAILLHDNSVLEAGQGGHFWRNSIAACALVGLVVAAVFFSDDLAQQWANLTAVDSSSTAVEFEPPKG